MRSAAGAKGRAKAAKENNILAPPFTLCYKVTMLALLKRPNAFVPLAISAAFLAALLGELLRGTLVLWPDEGALAHLFQILMPLQIPIIAWFAIV